MLVRFWGVRGSVPVPGPTTVEVGGNTACVSVETDDVVVVLDAGTGIKDLGLSLRGDRRPVVVLSSHSHWDHLIGFPYFMPLWEEGREIVVVATDESGASPLDLLDGKHFPKHHASLPSNCRLRESDGYGLLADHDLRLSSIALRHPGGCRGFRLDGAAGSFCYLTDHEIDGPQGEGATFAEVADFTRGCDVLCHDAQFASREIVDRRGWGHSDVDRVCELARVAGTRHLVLYHHDPMRSDAEVHDIELHARSLLAPHEIDCTAAREGLALDLGDGS